MPNWCNTSYVIEGDVEEVKSLYETMKELQERKTPLVKNDFGKTWLGCLVNALGGDWNDIYCRGDWNDLEMIEDTLRFSTQTAWGTCNEAFDFIREKFPSLSYLYQSEESGMGEYWTNDVEGKYFTDKYIVNLYTPDEEYEEERFTDLSGAFEYLEEISGQPIKSKQDVNAFVEQWQKENEDAFCNIIEYQIEK